MPTIEQLLVFLFIVVIVGLIIWGLLSLLDRMQAPVVVRNGIIILIIIVVLVLLIRATNWITF